MAKACLCNTRYSSNVLLSIYLTISPRRSVSRLNFEPAAASHCSQASLTKSRLKPALVSCRLLFTDVGQGRSGPALQDPAADRRGFLPTPAFRSGPPQSTQNRASKGTVRFSRCARYLAATLSANVNPPPPVAFVDARFLGMLTKEYSANWRPQPVATELLSHGD